MFQDANSQVSTCIEQFFQTKLLRHFQLQVARIDSDGPRSLVVDSFNLSNIIRKSEKYFKLMEMIGEFPPSFDLGSNSGVLKESAWNKLIDVFVKSVTEGGPHMQDPAGYVLAS